MGVRRAYVVHGAQGHPDNIQMHIGECAIEGLYVLRLALTWGIYPRIQDVYGVSYLLPLFLYCMAEHSLDV